MYPTISKPEKYSFPKSLYLIDSDEVRGSGPQCRDKRNCKVALTKAFGYYERATTRYYGNQPNYNPVEYVTTRFGVRKIYNYNGDLIFERNSPIMIEFAKGNVTKEQVVNEIPL